MFDIPPCTIYTGRRGMYNMGYFTLTNAVRNRAVIESCTTLNSSLVYMNELTIESEFQPDP